MDFIGSYSHPLVRGSAVIFLDQWNRKLCAHRHSQHWEKRSEKFIWIQKKCRTGKLVVGADQETPDNISDY